MGWMTVRNLRLNLDKIETMTLIRHSEKKIGGWAIQVNMKERQQVSLRSFFSIPMCGKQQSKEEIVCLFHPDFTGFLVVLP